MYEPNVTEINFLPVKPNRGLIGFCSFILDNAYYVGNVSIFSKLDGEGIRLVYPKKNNVDCFHPITRIAGEGITKIVQEAWDNFISQRN